MNEFNKQTETSLDVAEVPVTAVNNSMSGAAVSRRRLIRAGLSAAPVMLVLKSQSVLAADICIKPSAFSSLTAANMKLSHMPNPAGYTCHSYTYWQTNAHPVPYFIQANSYFLTPLPSNAPNGSITAGFLANPGNAYTGLTLKDVLNTTGNANNAALARYVVGTFLTAVANGDNPAIVLLTTAQCRAVWDGQGFWSPMAEVNWTLTDTMAYFDYVYGP